MLSHRTLQTRLRLSMHIFSVCCSDLIMWMNLTLIMEQERRKIHPNFSIKVFLLEFVIHTRMCSLCMSPFADSYHSQLTRRILLYLSVLSHSKLIRNHTIALRGFCFNYPYFVKCVSFEFEILYYVCQNWDAVIKFSFASQMTLNSDSSCWMLRISFIIIIYAFLFVNAGAGLILKEMMRHR